LLQQKLLDLQVMGTSQTRFFNQDLPGLSKRPGRWQCQPGQPPLIYRQAVRVLTIGLSVTGQLYLVDITRIPGHQPSTRDWTL